MSNSPADALLKRLAIEHTGTSTTSLAGVDTAAFTARVALANGQLDMAITNIRKVIEDAQSALVHVELLAQVRNVQAQYATPKKV